MIIPRRNISADLVRCEDGCHVFMPSDRMGFLTSAALRQIADYIDELDAPWLAEIARACAAEVPEPIGDDLA